MTVNYKELQKRLFNRVHRTGEEIKNDFPNILQSCIKHKAWEHFSTVDGKPFKNLGEWLVYSFPNGVSMGSSWSVVSYEDALQLCKDHRELHGLLVKHRPSGGAGGRPKKGDKPVDNVNRFPKRHTGINTRAYIEQRLQKDFPKIWKQYVAGNFKSARQAGIAAGFISDSHDPVKRLKSNWSKATTKQRKEFLSWIQEAK